MGRVVLALPLWKGVRKSQKFEHRVGLSLCHGIHSDVNEPLLALSQPLQVRGLQLLLSFIAVLSLLCFPLIWMKACFFGESPKHPDSAATSACSLRI